MGELQTLCKQAAEFRARRASLVEELKREDAQYQTLLQEAESRHRTAAEDLETSRQAACAALDDRAKQESLRYAQKKATLQSFLKPIQPWCSASDMRDYQPDPAMVREEEVNDLIEKIQANGILAWIMRTFRLGGYASRKEMAAALYRKIEDASAYCNQRIDAANTACEQGKQKETTLMRRRLQDAGTQYAARRQELEERHRTRRALALDSLKSFDTSAELRAMHQKIERMRQEEDRVCGPWGEYTAPSRMPERVLLGHVGLSLPDGSGIDRSFPVPFWLDLFACNIVVVTGSSSAAAGADCPEKRLVRQFLARMLKTVPPECCSYSVFDALHKGASLARLVDLTNAGTTDISFDLFTSNNSDGKNVTCAERRKYLRDRPAEIIRSTAGRSSSLFDYNRESGEFAFPFTWIVDFSFPEDPDARLLDDVKEMFLNARAAGYSFLFVTNAAGYQALDELARTCSDIPVLQVDCDRMQCVCGNETYPFVDTGGPDETQIYNFMTALKKFYDEGGAIDNRIEAVFARQGIRPRDAAQKLTIPMALDSRGRLVDIEFGGEGSVHGFISGSANSGKSTLLHTIILSACLHHRPDDLEIWLIDYKQTEFHLYKKRTPPHIKLIGVSKTADFTFSLLDKIEEEASRRTALMNRFDAQNLAEYRRHAGEPGYENITRLFLVIDEFHEMSQFVSTETAYKDKLENILREYRAQGITCLMADQTFSTGLSGLTLAAKNQIGLRIAMRNEASPQEIKETLEVDRALYSDSMQRTIAIMSQGEFIMKVYVRNARGELTDVRLEKFKGLNTKGKDIGPIAKALQTLYQGQYRNDDLIYVNTKAQVPWSDAEAAALNRMEPFRYPNARLFLGRAATLCPCFGLDLGRQPNENVSVVGGTVHQRWELLASVIRSCAFQGYKLLAFLAEYSDLMNDHGQEIRDLCRSVPNAEVMESTTQWCQKLRDLDAALTDRQDLGDTICVFLGLEIAQVEFKRLPEQSAPNRGGRSSFLSSALQRYAALDAADMPAPAPEELEEFNALPLLEKLFSNGARSGLRCVAEVSVFRQLSKIPWLKDMCRHKIAFSMSADDCMNYLGSSSYQKSIGQHAVYNNGGKEVKTLLPYRLEL